MINKLSKKRSQERNDRGAVLVISLFTMVILFGLTASFALSTVGELSLANRNRDATRAFWAAEAGLNRFLQDTDMLNGIDTTTFDIGGTTVTLSKVDGSERLVTASANVNGTTRQLQLTFPQNPPRIYDNSIASGGDIHLDALFAVLDVNDTAKISGSYTKDGFFASADFENLVEGEDPNETTIKYPDADGNGTADEFNDFVQFNRDIVSLYDPSEVVYLTTDSTVFIFPHDTLIDKKVVFVEGSTPGSGDVEIFFDSTWAENQNLTVISTGSVSYLQPLQNPSANSKLNTISWDFYGEASILYSSHGGVNYTHDAAHIFTVLAYSKTKGNMVANEGVNAYMALATKQYDFANPLDSDGHVPPGFQGLVTGGILGYSDTPSQWQEI